MAPLPPDALLALLDDALAETPPGRCVWVALSGGLDSSLLLTLAARACQRRGRSLRALHVHHGLQPAAADFEAHCAALCQRLGVPLSVARVSVEPQGEGIEGAARRARYQAFLEHLAPGDTLWLGQHQDDQAETWLLAALRGSGIRGLAGMPGRREWQGRVLLRPWLSVRRDQLREAARQEGLAWCEDPTNQDIYYNRNYLRHAVLPVLGQRWPGAAQALARSAAWAGEADGLLASYAAEELAGLALSPGCIDAHALAALPLPRQRLLVRTLCQQYGLPTPPQARLVSLLDQLRAAAQARVHIIWPGAEARVWRGGLYVMAPQAPLDGWQAEWDGRAGLATPLGTLALEVKTGAQDAASASFVLRGRQGGETLVLPGRGRRDLKRWLQEQSIPPWERQRLLLVMEGERCLAILQPPARVLWQAAGVAVRCAD
ncbi:tRNA lysidine(34) synthetase TilS [Halomonas sp. 18071143]|uniref:tRNA lysidine(34) synthetase TilS n=1 Tax=Halomonas sp. 18071143 TaxID=2855441 RepID=UPI001C494760|nr:tRNA lysidine(34) synthetase TilS [Halomonas sp. 18071143]